ncbi:MAG: restriction endonuclease [Planctomycetes bacterium]|nr:restriction endonuclease [Planctomycetota bacterium]
MSVYKLDELGWHDFETLVQSLLKTKCGMGVEAWGGHGDFGRDAFSPFPVKLIEAPPLEIGPVVFQAKFVNNANAAGADYMGALQNAVSKESTKIKNSEVIKKAMNLVGAYVLLTNAPISATEREKLQVQMSKALPKIQVVVWGGGDIGAMLDNHPKIRQSFPQLLSIRDLEALLTESVSKAIRNKSRVAVDRAREIASVFVPVNAYSEARGVLHKHHWVVLDGPPEVGKTAIARVIALTQLLAGWEAIECSSPDELFGQLNRESKQVFVIDDAFGKTEFDPGLARKWERDLPNVIASLGEAHWLVMTTRRHVLATALRHMDLSESEAVFPQAGEVLVSVDKLSLQERAHILYRHAKHAKLGEDTKSLIRRNALDLCKNPHFTPERVRRFVTEGIVELSSTAKLVSAKELDTFVQKEISSPTDRMRKSLRALKDAHKHTVYSTLDCNLPCEKRDITESAQRMFGARTAQVEKAIEDLIGSFLKQTVIFGGNMRPGLDWIHPSYRDLVIECAAEDRDIVERLFASSSSRIMNLLLSSRREVADGESLRFVESPEDCTKVIDAAARIASTSPSETIAALFESVVSALRDRDRIVPARLRQFIISLASASTEEVVKRCNSGALTPSVRTAIQVIEIGSTVGLLDASIVWTGTWKKIDNEIGEQIDNEELRGNDLSDWIDLAHAINKHQGTTDAGKAIPAHVEQRAANILKCGETMSTVDHWDDAEQNDQVAKDYESLAEQIGYLGMVSSFDDLDGISERLNNAAERLRQYGVPEPDYDDDYSPGGTDAKFDIDELFTDL